MWTATYGVNVPVSVSRQGWERLFDEKQSLAEQELLQMLNKNVMPGQTVIQGLLSVTTTRGKRTSTIQLRPDAVAHEDGLTWLEVDRSKRGPDREASLASLASLAGEYSRTAAHLVGWSSFTRPSVSVKEPLQCWRVWHKPVIPRC